MIAGPFDQYREAFRIAEIKSFDDLHRLGFIPERITEKHAITAFEADHREFSAAVLRAQEQAHSCSCDNRQEQAALPKRRHYQKHLIEVLQPLYRAPLAADDPAVVHRYWHIKQWLYRADKHLIGLFALRDINIGKRATLIMTPTVKAVYANNVNIDAFGRLRFTAGHVHVRCKALNGPTPLEPIGNKFLAGLISELQGGWR